MSDKELNYFEDLAYDSNKLDEELDKQPIINMRYHELLADKNEELNEQKRIVKIKETEVKEKYAACFLMYKQVLINGKAPSDGVADKSVLVDKDYKKKLQELWDETKKLNKIIKQSEVLDGVVKSFQQRKNALEKRVDLWICGYHGQVKQKDSAKKTQDAIKSRLNRKEDE